jgi:hypothetical protein
MSLEEKAPSVKELYFSYFIGRCNPPHQGHFHMINAAITAARENSGKALILLGSGPKAKVETDRRTEKDPLIFKLKKEIIEKNIYCVNDKSVKDENQKQELELESVILEEPNYEIVEMTNPTDQVIEFVETELQSQLTQLINDDDDTSLIKITVHHFAGAKENDATKLEFVRRALENKIKEEYNNVDIETEPVTFCLDSQDNNIPMSATLIRKDAYDNNKDKFENTHKDIYGDYAGIVYDAIIEGKRIGEETLKKYTDSKTRKKTVCKSQSFKMKKDCTPNKQIVKKKGGKRKTNKRKTNKRKTNKRNKTNKRRKTNKRKIRKTKRTNKRKK